MALKLPCGVELPTVSLFLQAASPFFRDALEDVKGSTLIPVSRTAKAVLLCVQLLLWMGD
jgi:hypothetical protein